MTTVAVMQPTFLPWLGYFDLMAHVDTFVVLDSVQLDHRSWQHRNRIATERGLVWLTVPIDAADHRARIDRCRIGASDDFPGKVVGRLEATYRGCPGYALLEALLARIARSSTGDLLVDLDLDLIEEQRPLLDITTPIVRSSTLEAFGARGELLLAICREVGATTYATPPGSVDYLRHDADAFRSAGIDILVHEYEHPEYPQGTEAFLSHAAAVDAIARTATGAPAVLASGHRSWRPLAEHIEGSAR